MKQVVLVLTNSEDGIHTDIVIEKLRKKGALVFRFDVDKLASGEMKVKFFSTQTDFGFTARYRNKIVDSRDVKSIWYRRSQYLNLQISDLAQRDFAKNETNSFLEGLWLSMKEVFWVNDFHNLERARKKILQLRIAREIGFRVPSTIVTNNPVEVKNFFIECEERIIFKTLKQGFLEHEDGEYNIPTTLIAPCHIEHIDLVKHLPSLFQEYINKDYELRITVVGERIFAVKIDFQIYSEAPVDWRHPDIRKKLSYKEVYIPSWLIDLCFVMMKKLGLQFGAFDIAVDKHGQYFFLEINPNGQWYWLERLAGVCISDAISDILCIGLCGKEVRL